MISQHFWRELHSLIIDGIAVTQRKLGMKTRSGSRAGGGNAVSSRLLTDGTSERGSKKDGKHASSDGGKRDSSAGKKSKESKSGKGGSKSKGTDKDKESPKSSGKDKRSLNELAASESSPEPARGTAAERLLTEQVEQDERLHQSQAKIKVIGLNASTS